MGNGTIPDPPMRVLGSAPDTARFNIVVLAEGFGAGERTAFDTGVDGFLTELRGEAWWPVLGSVINVHKLWIESAESGVDDVTTGEMRDTYFDAGYVRDRSGNIALRVNLTRVDTALQGTSLEGRWQAAGVYVNAGPGRGLAYASGSRFTAAGVDWPGAVIHELGHAGFGLADEYDQPGTFTPPPGFTDFVEPNVTVTSSATGLRWSDLLMTTSVPTMVNPNCSTRDTRPNVLADDFIVGLYGGARYHACGVYRPTYTCKMRRNVGPFCRVCLAAVHQRLSAYATPRPDLRVNSLDSDVTIDFGEAPAGTTVRRAVDIANIRNGWPGVLAVTLTSGSTPQPFSFSGSPPATFPIDVAVPGSVAATLDWGAVARPYSLSGTAGLNAAVDLPVEATAPGTLSATLQWSSAANNLDLSITDPNGMVVASATGLTTRPETLSVPVSTVGTYQVTVRNAAGAATAFTVTGNRPVFPVLTLALRNPAGTVVAPGSAARPSTLAFSVPAADLGRYVLAVTTADDAVAFTLNGTTPTAAPLAAPFALAPGTPTRFTLPAPIIDPHSQRTVNVELTVPATGGPVFTSALDVVAPADQARPVLRVNLRGGRGSPGVPLRVVEVSAPEINTWFDPSGTLVVDDLGPSIPIGGGAGFLQSRIYPRGLPGTGAANLFPYEFRVSLEPLASDAGVSVRSVSLDFGPAVARDWAGTGDAEVFVITQGGIGTVRPSAVTLSPSGMLTLAFGAGVPAGQTSYFIGLASMHPPREVTALVHDGAGNAHSVQARGGNHP